MLSGLGDAVGEVAGLHPDAPGSPQWREEQALAPEGLRGHSADQLDRVLDGLVDSDETVVVDPLALSRLARPLEDVSLRADGCEPIPGELLEDEPLTTEESGSEPPCGRDPDRDPASAEEGVSLAEDRSLGEVDGLDVGRLLWGEADLPSNLSLVLESRHEEARSGELALQAREQTAPRGSPHLDALGHEHERPLLCLDGFAGGERDHDGAEVVTEESVPWRSVWACPGLVPGIRSVQIDLTASAPAGSSRAGRA